MKHFLDLIFSFLFPITKEERLFKERLESISPQLLLENAPSILPIPDDGMLAALNYQQIEVKEIIWQLKYKGRKKLATLLAQCLYESLIAELSDKKLFDNFTEPLLIPIPLSKKRLRERGFNQSELIAREMSFIDGDRNFTIETSVLYRIKDNEHQAHIKDRRARFENSKRTFTVLNRDKVLKRNIILLDDVITSGATMLSAKEELLNAGARMVFMISVAH